MAEATGKDHVIKVGISTCLLGQKVRFDGGHKRDRYITDVLGEYFRFVPVCPELEVGMGLPREAVRLVGDPASPRMIGNRSLQDWTDRMNTYAAKRVRQRDLTGLSGYILKKDSPSCGMARVKVYNDRGMPEKNGVGLFAQALQQQLPLLPIEEEGRLNDPRLREEFHRQGVRLRCPAAVVLRALQPIGGSQVPRLLQVPPAGAQPETL